MEKETCDTACDHVIIMLTVHLLAALVLATSQSVSAALYATHPVAQTVYKAGYSALLTWKDDGSNPRLGDMGKVWIDLRTGDDVSLENITVITSLNIAQIHLARLAIVDPTSLKHTVVIPSNVPPSSSGLYVCFSRTSLANHHRFNQKHAV
jgi:hypothetical protein